MCILLVEDDIDLRRSLADRLHGVGYVVDVAADGEEGLFAGLHYPVELAIVDLGLPKLPGEELIRRWRASGLLFPVLALTARNSWKDRVVVLDAGADDYVSKPVKFGELNARMRALIRRSHGWAGPEIECGPYVLDTVTRTVRCQGKKLTVTSFEYRVLEFLMLREGETISVTQIETHLYGEGPVPDTKRVPQFIFRLRGKLDPQRVLHPIETMGQHGYRFSIPRSGGSLVRSPRLISK